MGVQSIRIERFKSVEQATLPLKAVNVLVGANNAGKSTLIQAIHFAIGLLQSIRLADRWQDKDFTVSLDPDGLIYSPSDDPYALGEGGRLLEKAARQMNFEFVLDTGESFSVNVRKGRIKNLLASVKNPAVAKVFSELKAPFSVFSPGLAGIAKHENFVSDGVLLRALARGDANLVLRNILLRLHRQPKKWVEFTTDLSKIFPNSTMEVDYDENLGEFIVVKVVEGDKTLPLELAGTGFLQSVQILSYIYRFDPKLIVLDEPDSHLHPNNQRLISSLLLDIAQTRGTQILITTHSRHVVDTLLGSSQYLWVRNGAVAIAGASDEVGVLMDIGALDIRERLAQNKKSVVVLTEDTVTRNLERLLKDSGFDFKEMLLLPYYGVTNIANLIPIIKHIRDVSPKCHILLHRDRDYLNDMEVAMWSQDVRKQGVEIFVTLGTDVESYFCNADYLAHLNPEISKGDFDKMISVCATELEEATVQSYINGRVDIERKAGNFGKMDLGKLSVACTKEVAADRVKFAKGKALLSRVRQAFREGVGKNLKYESTEVPVVDERLTELAKLYFGSKKSIP